MSRVAKGQVRRHTDGAMRHYRYSRSLNAGCFTCKGSDCIWNGPNAQGVAARHRDATGHETWVDIYMSIRYCKKKESGK